MDKKRIDGERNAIGANEDAGERLQPRRLLLGFLAVLGVWTFLGVFLGFQQYLNGLDGEKPIALAQAVKHSLSRYLIYVLLTPFVYWVCRRFSFSVGRRAQSIAAHAMAFAVFTSLFTIIWLFVLAPPALVARGRIHLGIAVTRANLFEQFWMYGSIAGVLLAIQYYGRFRRRELREAEFKRRMAEYELQILKLQLHPHFLFNTLNGISALMTSDVKTAREMLVRLSDLLRIALSHSSDKEVSLREEMEFIGAYLQLEQMRFGSRLQVVVKIDPETLDARVPNMVLQPLVENAVRHGIGALRAGGTVEVTSKRVNGSLRITVANDGPPLDSQRGRTKGTGLGLGNTRARLWQLYGDTCQLRIGDRSGGGVQVDLNLPFAEVAIADVEVKEVR